MNTELLKPGNLLIIGLVSVVFTILVNIAHNQINNKEGE